MEMARAPKLFALIFLAIFGMVVLVNKGNGASSQDVTMSSLHLDDGYLLYFQPKEDASEAGSESVVDNTVLRDYALSYVGFVSHTLDASISQQFDTLIYGFSFTLDYTPKVYKALGEEQIESGSEKTTDDRLYAFLVKYKEDEMAKHGVTMVLERDKTMSTQGQQNAV